MSSMFTIVYLFFPFCVFSVTVSIDILMLILESSE